MKAIHGSIGLLLVVLAACHPGRPSTTVQPSKSFVTEADCNDAYSRILAVALCENLTEEQKTSADVVFQLGKDFDNYYRSKGVTSAFYESCMHKMNLNQVQCIKHAESFSGMSMCAKLFEEPPPIDEMPAKDTSL